MKTREIFVDIPADLVDLAEFPSQDDWIRELGDHAIDQAREQMDDYVIPCQWTAQHVSGDADSFHIKFKVIRESN